MTEAPLPPGCDSRPFDPNVTLGPLDIDYLYLHYCVFAGLPLVSAAVLFSWLALLFYFRE